MRIILLFLITGLLSGCTATAAAPENSSVTTRQKQSLSFSGQVIRVELEGGFFGLEDEQGRHYLPDRIPEELKKDGQEVQVEAHPAPPSVGFRMWGERIIIDEITAR
jgi:hypothetical protein